MRAGAAPSVGETARPLELPDLGGNRVRLEDLRGRAVLLVFLRHAGCLICRAHLVKVLHHRRRVDALGTAVFVAFDPPQLLERTLLRGLELPYPLLVDPERSAYRAWGLGRGSVLGVWADLRVWLRYARELARGERLRRPGSDTLQLGGDFVIDPKGAVAYSRPQRRDDRPPVAELLQALERAARESTAGRRASKWV